MDYSGLLLVDKPKDWTSHDVVAKVRGTLKKQAGQKIKVGHTGTLDPLATGLMVIVVGDYCKRAEQFSRLDKTYAVTMKLGETSNTGDAEGQIEVRSTQAVDLEQVEAALKNFTGEIMQTPPAFSAIKVDGKRAYKLAREGKKVVLEPRLVNIHEIDLKDYVYPFANFTASVSSGTYIRSLVEDIGEELGSGAYMSDLRRIRVGKFEIAKSLQISDLAGVELRAKLIKP